MAQALPASPCPGSPVSLCELESLHQQQQDIFNQMTDFVRSDALVTDLYNVQKKTYRYLLTLGKA